MSFHVGQKVVCVDASNYFRTGDPHGLVKNAIYQVSECHNWGAVSLAGFHQGYRHAFANSRFRPVQERSTETGMAILKKVADDAAKRKQVTVNA